MNDTSCALVDGGEPRGKSRPGRRLDEGLSSASLRDLLDSVDARLEALLRVDPEADDPPTERLAESARRLCLAGGKRARPWIVAAFAEALGLDGPGPRDLAVCVELLHTASLLHDDVIDLGEVRRGQPTANVVYGNLTAVLAGDLLMTRALGALEPYESALLHAAIGAVAEMSLATAREAAARGRADTSIERWRAIAAGKTGALFALCGRGVGLLAGDAGAGRRLQRAGEHLGVAFQIADDLDDIVGRAAGKGQLVDLRLGNPSHPLLWAASADPAVADALATAWAAGEVPLEDALALARAVRATGALEASREAIGREIELLEETLAPWSDRPPIASVLTWARGL